MMNTTKLIRLTVLLTLALTLFAGALSVDAQPKKKEIERAKRLTKMGGDLFNRKDFKGAIAKYAEALTIVPTLAEASFWKGWSHYFINEPEQAIADLTTAEQNKFDKPLEIYKLRWLLYYKAGNFEAALADAKSAASLDPNNASYQIGAGDIYMSQKSYAEAIPPYQRAMELDKSTSEVPYQLAIAFDKLGRYEERLAAAMEALKRGTLRVGECNYFIGDSLYRNKKYTEAIEFYQRALDVKPDIYEVYGPLAEIYRIRNEFDRATDIARRGIVQFPRDARLYSSLAWYYSLADKPKEAIIAAKGAISLQPDLASAHTNLCRAHNDAAEYQNAVNACTAALKLNPGDGETYLYMARAYEFLKQSDKSIDAYKKAVDGLQKDTQANPDVPDGFYLLGNAYFAINKDTEAIAAYNRCLTLAPRFAKARFSLGYTYLINNDKVKAREQFELLKGIDANLAEKLRVAIDK